MDEHQDVPILLLGRETNGGLPRARNLGVSRASAAKVMILDADNSRVPDVPAATRRRARRER